MKFGKIIKSSSGPGPFLCDGNEFLECDFWKGFLCGRGMNKSAGGGEIAGAGLRLLLRGGEFAGHCLPRPWFRRSRRNRDR